MNTTEEQILQRLKLLPKTMLPEALLFIEFLLSRLRSSSQTPTNHSKPSFAQALNQFRAQVEAEGSDLDERDFFEDIRDRTLAPKEARW